MTRSLLGGPNPDALAAESPDDRLTDLQVAEAELAAAEAEAAAARARADAATARARLARLRGGESERTDHASQVHNGTADNSVAPSDRDDGEETTADDIGSSNDAAAQTATGSVDQPPLSDTVDRAARHGKLHRILRSTGRPFGRLRHPTKRGLAIGVMALVTIAALAAAAAIGWRHHQADTDRARAAAFTAAADRGVTAITSLDFKNAKRDVQHILDQSTGEFYNDFKSRADDFTSVIEQSKVTTKGEVTGSAVESMTDDSAVVLVSASSDVTNAAGAKQEPRTWRLRVTMTDADGTTKISKVDFVP